MRYGVFVMLLVLGWSSPALGVQLLYEVEPLSEDWEAVLGTSARMTQYTQGGKVLGRDAEGKIFVWAPERGYTFREAVFLKEFTYEGDIFLSDADVLYGMISYTDDFGLPAPANVLDLNTRQFRSLEPPPKFLDEHEFCEIERFLGVGLDSSVLGQVHCRARDTEGDRHAFRVRGGSAILAMPVFSTTPPGSPQARWSRATYSDANGAVYGSIWDENGVVHGGILTDPPELFETMAGLTPEALFPVMDKLTVGLSGGDTAIVWRNGVLSVPENVPFNCPLMANGEGLILARARATCDRTNSSGDLATEWGVTNDLLTWTSSEEMTFLYDGDEVDIVAPIAVLDDNTIYAHYQPEPGRLIPVILKPKIIQELEIKNDYDVPELIELGEPFGFTPTIINRPTSFEVVGAEIVGDIDRLVTLAAPITERTCELFTVENRGDENEEKENPVTNEVGAIFDRFRCAFEETDRIEPNKRARFPFQIITDETGVLNSGFTASVEDESGARDMESAATDIDVVEWSGGVSCEVGQVNETSPRADWKAVTGGDEPEPSDYAHAVWAVTVRREMAAGSQALTKVGLEIGVPEGVELSPEFGAWRVAAADERGLAARTSGPLGVTCAERTEVTRRVFACELDYKALYDAWEDIPSDVTIFFGLRALADVPESEITARALSWGTKGDCEATVAPNFGGTKPTGPVGGCCATVSHGRPAGPWAPFTALLLGLLGARGARRRRPRGA